MTIKKGTSTIATSGTIDWGSIEGTLSDQTDLQNALSAKAPTLSPSFTGVPTAPTAAAGSNTSQIATTEFVKSALDNIDALPDQTDMEGKYLTTDGTNAYWKSPSGLPLLAHIWADHILNDASFLRADTFSWQSGGLYKSVYEHLVDDFDNGIIGCSDTDGGVTVFYRLCPDGHKICLEDQEQNVIDYYNANGSCWIYILDVINKRFKLPRTKYGFVGYRDGVGNYVEPGLPNITGAAATGTAVYPQYISGCLYSVPDETLEADVPSAQGVSGNFGFDASLSNSIYGNSTTVQPPATQMYLYFYAGDTVRNQTEIDVGEITEALDGKLDQDLSNAAPIYKETVVGYGAPDYTAGVGISLPYTAPCDGYVFICFYTDRNTAVYTIDGSNVIVNDTGATGVTSSHMIRIGKNQILAQADPPSTLNGIVFYPCLGVNNA